ncbi:hypothetical protein Poli38472_007305 [Pythium oligandrum]|uniref:Uncharacterized protein n=1 Tax=Pythium oligandrum TaxID=41045 RepID=A0A8K1FD84_PYTOL|nr:hypothetical protein Poli38472_007305 [Pythium oligandrum]|eukprot:TMW59160.1 hypothetical protein Poli38472_007305 [Pythium oligandrum]
MQCDAFYPLKLAGKHAHLSSLGVNCTLGGVKRIEETVFICAYRMDTFMCATGILADLVDAPLPVPPQTNGIYGSFFNLDERDYRAKLAAVVQPEDVPSIQAAVKRVAETFATRTSTWEKALCYEMVPMAHPGESQTRVQAVEHGCIWMNRARNETVAFHIEPTAGKYYLALSELLGLH